MKKLILSLMTIFMVFSAFSQTVPPAPGTGRWVIVDTNYTVGTSTAGITKANLYYRNNTSTKLLVCSSVFGMIKMHLMVLLLL